MSLAELKHPRPFLISCGHSKYSNFWANENVKYLRISAATDDTLTNLTMMNIMYVMPRPENVIFLFLHDFKKVSHEQTKITYLIHNTKLNE